MADAGDERRVIQRLRELLVSLPYDLKLLAEAMGDDELPAPARALAAGGTIYCLMPHDVLPDSHGVIGYVDDVVLFRVVLGRFRAAAGPSVHDYAERFPEALDQLDADLRLFRTCFDRNMDWIDHRIDRFAEVKYKGKKISHYLEQEEAALRLYEEAQEFLTEYDIDTFAAERLVSLKPVLEAFRKQSEGDSIRRPPPAAA